MFQLPKINVKYFILLSSQRSVIAAWCLSSCQKWLISMKYLFTRYTWPHDKISVYQAYFTCSQLFVAASIAFASTLFTKKDRMVAIFQNISTTCRVTKKKTCAASSASPSSSPPQPLSTTLVSSHCCPCCCTDELPNGLPPDQIEKLIWENIGL